MRWSNSRRWEIEIMFKQQKWYWGPKTLCFVLPKPLTIDSIGYCVKSGQVQYFNIDKGLDSGDKKVAMDMACLKYLMKDVPPVKEGDSVKVSTELAQRKKGAQKCL